MRKSLSFFFFFLEMQPIAVVAVWQYNRLNSRSIREKGCDGTLWSLFSVLTAIYSFLYVRYILWWFLTNNTVQHKCKNVLGLLHITYLLQQNYAFENFLPNKNCTYFIKFSLHFIILKFYPVFLGSHQSWTGCVSKE